MYNEEQQESNLALMVERGFPIGRFVYDSNESITPNALVSTLEDGPFWYGDLTDSDAIRLATIATELNRVLWVHSLTGTQEYSISPTL